MRLYRSHGLGNDYLVLEDGLLTDGQLTPAIVRALCDRHTGVGSDGVLEPVPPAEGADYGLRIHNPDGSQAEKSGNGLRIYADWLVRFRGARLAFRVWTPGGVVGCEVGARVRVTMGVARLSPARMLCGMEAWPVDIGNPHHVVFGVPADWEAIGARMEHAVPGRTNVQFVEVVGPGVLRVWVWERGAGRTRSSGSSACAVAMAAVATGRVSSPVCVQMEGGELDVTVGPDGAVTLEGPVEGIGRMEVEAGWLGRIEEGRG